MPCPRVAVLLVEHLGDHATVVARARTGLVDVRSVHPTVRLGVPVARVLAASPVGMEPAGLHLAVLLPKIGIWAVACPYMGHARSACRSHDVYYSEDGIQERSAKSDILSCSRDEVRSGNRAKGNGT